MRFLAQKRSLNHFFHGLPSRLDWLFLKMGKIFLSFKPSAPTSTGLESHPFLAISLDASAASFLLPLANPVAFVSHNSPMKESRGQIRMLFGRSLKQFSKHSVLTFAGRSAEVSALQERNPWCDYPLGTEIGDAKTRQ